MSDATHATHATASYHHDTTASAAAIWEFFKAVPDWKSWNAGVYSCELDGPFAEGAWMTMVLPDQEVIRSQLIEVSAPNSFTDETLLGDVAVRVKHEIRPLPTGIRRIVYTIEVEGAGAEEICAGVSADFPDVLRALAAQAEQRRSQ